MNLRSFQLLAFRFDPTHIPPLGEFVSACGPLRRRFLSGPPIAAIQSLTLRPSYRFAFEDYMTPIFTALLLALSPTLLNLHLGGQFAHGACILPLASAGICPHLQRLWLGFNTAQVEVGDGARLSIADDRRVRSGIYRGDESLLDIDPLVGGPVGRDGLVPPLSGNHLREAARTGGLISERVVLGRLSLDESLVRLLVDPLFSCPWPPHHIPVTTRVARLLSPWPFIIDAVSLPRRRILTECHIFETEYVGSVGRQQQICDGRRIPERWEDGPQGGRGGGDGWTRVMNGNFGFNR